MPIPNQEQTKAQIVQYLRQHGGQAKTSDIHEYLAKEWNLTHEEKSERNQAGGIRWHKQIDGAIAALNKAGQVSHPQRGTIKLTFPEQSRESPVTTDAATPSKAVPTAREHDELMDLLERVGKSLGYVVKREQGPVYRHDLSFSRNEYQNARLVIEICDKGNVDKDIVSLRWAVENLECKAILATVDEKDYHKATEVIGANPNIVVVKAEAIHQLSPLVSQITLLRMLFGT